MFGYPSNWTSNVKSERGSIYLVYFLCVTVEGPQYLRWRTFQVRNVKVKRYCGSETGLPGRVYSSQRGVVRDRFRRRVFWPEARTLVSRPPFTRPKVCGLVPASQTLLVAGRPPSSRVGCGRCHPSSTGVETLRVRVPSTATVSGEVPVVTKKPPLTLTRGKRSRLPPELVSRTFVQRSHSYNIPLMT